MLDDSDSDFAWLLALTTNGWSALVILLIALVVTATVCSNKADCRQHHCKPGATPKLISHECLCVERAE